MHIQRRSKTGTLIPPENAMAILPIESFLEKSSNSADNRDENVSKSLQELLYRAGEVLELEDRPSNKGFRAVNALKIRQSVNLTLLPMAAGTKLQSKPDDEARRRNGPACDSS